MSAQQENLSVPGVNLGHRQPKRKRRSSILKTAKPFEDIQNVAHGDERVLRDRRVSFCNTVEIKEFLKELPSHTRQPVLMGKPQKPDELLLEPHGEVRKVELAAEDQSFIQISTPVGKKRRRISFLSGAKIERFSIIPKLEKSSIDDDDDVDDDNHFEPFADLDDPLEHSGATAKKEDITLIEQLPEPEAGFPEDDFFSTQGDHQVDHSPCPSRPMVVLPHELTREQEASDMDLTCNELSLLDAEELLKQLQGDEHTGAKHPSKAENPSEMQPESHMSFTCVDSMPFHAQSTDSEVNAPQEKKPADEMSFTYVDPIPAEVQLSPRNSDDRMSETQSDSEMNFTFVGELPTRSHYTGMDQGSVHDEGSEMSLCIEIEEDITEAVQPQLVICDDRMQLTAVQLQDIEGAVTGVKAPNTRPKESQMPVNCTQKTTEPVLFQACKSTETVYEASMSLTCVHTGVSDAVHATIEQEIPGSKFSSMESTKSIPKLDQATSPTTQDRSRKSTETLYEASMSLTCVHTGVSDATIEQEIPGLKFTSMEATKSIPKLDQASKRASPIVQIEAQSESDIIVASEPVVQQAASDISSTVPPNVVYQVSPTNTTLQEASLPAATTDSTSACPNLKPASHHLSSPPTDGLFKQRQLPLKLAKHKSKLVIQPVITSSPALRTPHCTPVMLPPPGSKSLPAAQYLQVRTPGSLLFKKVRPAGVTPRRHHLNRTADSPECTKRGAYVEGNSDHHPQSDSSSSSRDGVCTDWLHSNAEDSFSLVGTSLESDPSPGATDTDTTACTQGEFEGHTTASFLRRSQMQSKHSVHQELVSSTGSSLSQLKKTVESLKNDENQCKDKTILVETPEAIPLKRSNPMKDVSPTLDVTAAEVSQESMLGQSVMMSPSAFTKFLGALKCDKSMNANSFYASPTQLVEGSAEDASATTQPSEPITSPEVKPQEYSLQPQGKLSEMEIHENRECETSLMPNDHTWRINEAEDNQQEEPSVIKPDKHAVNTTFTLEEQPQLQKSGGIHVVHIALDVSMDSECTLNEKADASHVSHTTQPFSTHSQDLHNRLSAVAKEIQLRLSSAEYLRSDSRIEATLKCWLQVLNMYLCSLNTVIQFGSLSGLSVSHLCDIPQLVSCPPVSRGDMTGSKLQKAQWIWAMIQWIQELHPIVQATLDNAASFYPWEIVTWSEEEVEVEIQSQMALKLKLKLSEDNPQQTGGFNKEITAIYTDSEQGSWIDCKRKATIDLCRYTTDIADMLWKLSTEDISQ